MEQEVHHSLQAIVGIYLGDVMALSDMQELSSCHSGSICCFSPVDGTVGTQKNPQGYLEKTTKQFDAHCNTLFNQYCFTGSV